MSSLIESSSIEPFGPRSDPSTRSISSNTARATRTGPLLLLTDSVGSCSSRSSMRRAAPARTCSRNSGGIVLRSVTMLALKISSTSFGGSFSSSAAVQTLRTMDPTLPVRCPTKQRLVRELSPQRDGAAAAARSMMVTGVLGRTTTLPDVCGEVSTSVERARNAPTVQFWRPRAAMGS